ncbi:hypothetical protein IQ268_04295 [Oculatella sp. LEGE 06141]|uniref:hypothetical protein n=1 Tax=Oculatella sp. LEGE 06141 TaxID=1828648 RepID=UPI00187FD6DD|nr:hypothetical protein [Oculatella sp. LEGE 06141]MBE9177801.1 hypothetical protein [Oculatella sp. LEGE 06141]
MSIVEPPSRLTSRQTLGSKRCLRAIANPSSAPLIIVNSGEALCAVEAKTVSTETIALGIQFHLSIRKTLLP